MVGTDQAEQYVFTAIQVGRYMCSDHLFSQNFGVNRLKDDGVRSERRLRPVAKKLRRTSVDTRFMMSIKELVFLNGCFQWLVF